MPLEGNLVKLSVQLEEADFQSALDEAFRRIAKEVRVPGFRPGKTPRRILEARIGAGVARQEALREALPEYYARAVTETEVDAIAPPEFDLTSGAESGPVTFDAVVEVRPKVSVPGYANLRVTVPRPEIAEEEVDAQVERLRAQFGELRPVDRPVRPGDHVSIDLAGSRDGEPVEGLTADDYLYAVGSGDLVPDLDQRLPGAKVGDILAFDAVHPDLGSEDRISFRVLVKAVQEQVLPDLDDDWAAEASEFETLSELRGDLRARLEGMRRLQSQLRLRDGVMAALIDLVTDDPPEPLVGPEVERRAHDLARRLQERGLSLDQYLQSTDRDAEELSRELRGQAVSSVKADLALRAVAEAEGIAVTDAEVEAEVARLAARLDEEPAALRDRIERADQLQAIRSDLRKGKALEWLVEHVEIVDEDGQSVDRDDLDERAWASGAAEDPQTKIDDVEEQAE